MRYDFSPLYRSTVEFDRVFDMLDQATRVEQMTNWPPYTIENWGASLNSSRSRASMR